MGRSDVDLDDVGRRQATQAAVAVAPWRPTMVVSSPLRRAVNTAQPIAAAARVELRAEPRLVEMDFGRAVAIEGRRPKLDVKGRHRYERLPGGECLHDVWLRLLPVANELTGRVEAGQSTAVVGHYRASQLLEAMLLGCSFDEACERATYRPRNGSVHLVGPDTRCVWSPIEQ
jgi:glucosyl-3-phosphoglycerate phosphatase